MLRLCILVLPGAHVGSDRTLVSVSVLESPLGVGDYGMYYRLPWLRPAEGTGIAERYEAAQPRLERVALRYQFDLPVHLVFLDAFISSCSRRTGVGRSI